MENYRLCGRSRGSYDDKKVVVAVAPGVQQY